MHVYVGTYTRNAGSEGIYVFELDRTSGRLHHVQTVPDIEDPSYLTLGPGGRRLYAVSERADDGAVVAYAVEPSTGQLTVLNEVASHGAEPAHLSLDASSRWLLVANYSGGTIASLPIGSDGRLGEAADVVHHSGHGPRPDRQAAPHPHMILPDPHGAFVLVVDLGLDAVLGYRLDPASGRLVAQPDAGCRLQAGAGPRHLAFGADGRHVYVLDELDSTLVACAYTAATGQLRPLQTVGTLPEAFSDANYPAAVVVAASGRFVYASNRGHDSLAMFAIDQASGRLTPLGHVPIGGRWPRDICLDPTGTWLLAANQKSDQVTIFHVDAATGAVEPTGHAASVPKPTRVLVAPE